LLCQADKAVIIIVKNNDDNKPKLLGNKEIIKQNYSHSAIHHGKIRRTGRGKQLK
jgi:hypothetical protein